MPAAVTLYRSILALHIAAVMVGFGATFVAPVLLGLAAREPRHAPTAWRVVRTIDSRIVAPGMVVILAAGIYLATKGHYWSEFWVQWSIGAILVIGGVSGVVLAPREKRAIALADSKPDSPELAALNRVVGRVGVGLGVLVIITIFVMTAKPFS